MRILMRMNDPDPAQSNNINIVQIFVTIEARNSTRKVQLYSSLLWRKIRDRYPLYSLLYSQCGLFMCIIFLLISSFVQTSCNQARLLTVLLLFSILY